MKVLFVSSGNATSGISPIIKNQGESLKQAGIELEYFPIKGKGLKGYLKNIIKLKKFLKNEDFDIIHAHYSLTSFVATLAGAKPLIVSLMGSDVKEKKWVLLLIYFFKRFFWKKTIVKSEEMASIIGQNNVHVIPNGVNLEWFKPIAKEEAKSKVNLDINKKYILFAANPDRPEKNFSLAFNAYNRINAKNIELIYLKNLSHDQIPYYINSSEIVILSSLWEGSPNVIKEAIACNTPIVSTDVGDVKWIIGNTEGCFISSFEPEAMKDEIEKAFEFARVKEKTKGRERIIELGLDSDTIAQKIINTYQSILEKKK